jgi:hypothetical protein
MRTQYNRRQLLAYLGMAVTTACGRRSERTPDLQQPSESTVTLTVDGMI